MVDRVMEIHVISSGARLPCATLRDTGELIVENPDVEEMVAPYVSRGLSGDRIFGLLKRKSNAYVRYIES